MFVPRGVETRARTPRAAAAHDARGATRSTRSTSARSAALVDERERLRATLAVAFESDVKPSDRFLMERFVTGVDATSRARAARRGGVLHFENPLDRRRPTSGPRSRSSRSTSRPTASTGRSSRRRSRRAIDERVFVRGRGADDRGRRRSSATRAALLARALRGDPLDRSRRPRAAGTSSSSISRSSRRGAASTGVPFAHRSGGRDRARLAGRDAAAGLDRARPGARRARRHRDAQVGDVPLRALHARARRAASSSGAERRSPPGADALAEIRRMHAEDVDRARRLQPRGLPARARHLRAGRPRRLRDGARAPHRARRWTGRAARSPRSTTSTCRASIGGASSRPTSAADVEVVASPGGHVLDSVPGLYRDVLSFDFRSLYPSIIRTFRIDPLGLFQPGDDPLPGEDGATFAREGAILPALIETLHDARSRAMAAKNEALSRAIKILMNSFYGVLGTPGCRFFDPRLPTSITRRGHAIIERARAFFVERGLAGALRRHRLALRPPRGRRRARGDAEGARAARSRRSSRARSRTRSARELGVESHLELRFESHYLRFLMPTTRGGRARLEEALRGGGAEGATARSRVVVRGLEAVRTDWTPLARRVQRELLRRVFADEPFEAWLVETARDLAGGRLDDELVYRKRLRREAREYAQRRGAAARARRAHARREEGDDDARGRVRDDDARAGARRSGARRSITRTTWRSSSRRRATSCFRFSGRASRASRARSGACSERVPGTTAPTSGTSAVASGTDAPVSLLPMLVPLVTAPVPLITAPVPLMARLVSLVTAPVPFVTGPVRGTAVSLRETDTALGRADIARSLVGQPRRPRRGAPPAGTRETTARTSRRRRRACRPPTKPGGTLHSSGAVHAAFVQHSTIRAP